MNKTRGKPDRLRTEAKAQLDHAPSTHELVRSTEEILYELHVHQIELEMQNDELRKIQIALEESRDSYVDLYEFAPVGYLTLTREGMIAKANLTSATLLGVERKKLFQCRFAGFVTPEDNDLWLRHFLNVLQHDGHQSCELTLLHGNGSRFPARLDCLRMGAGSTSSMRLILTDISARKQVEEERRIAAIAFESQEGLIVTDANRVILRVNEAFTKLTGYSTEEVVGKTPKILQSGRQDKAFYRQMWATLKQENYWQGELWNKHKDGSIYYEWLTISAVFDPDGRVTHYIGSFSDITELKRAETFKQSILNSVPAEIAVLDRNGVILAVNQPWQRFALENGIEPGKLVPGIDVGTNYLDAGLSAASSATDGTQDAFDGVRAVLDGRLPNFSFEYPCDSPQQERWFRMNATLLGETAQDGVVITHTDITERKLAERILTKSRDQLKAFIQQAPISMAMLDQDMNYLATSGHWLVEFGRGFTDLIGRNHYEVNPEIPAKWKGFHQQALAGAALEKDEDMWIQADGSKRWLRWAIQPWADEIEDIGGIIIFAEDITAHKQLEAEIMERRNEMEFLQKQHIAAQTAAAIAHELNQPLLAIASYSEAALMLLNADKPNSDKIRRAIEGCERQAHRAGKSIRELLEFLSTKEFPTEAFDLNKEIREVINAARAEHELQFQPILRLEDKLPFIRANRTHIQKVLLNLLHNSIDAMREAGVPLPAITVTVHTKKDESVAQVTIQDNGPGVKKEDIQRLFDPFFTTKTTGIGMGLAISRSLIEENGGQLWIDPQEGPGAIFHLTLPFAK